MEPVDTQIDARWVIPVEPAGIVLEDHSVAIRDGIIVGVQPRGEANQRFEPAKRVELHDHALIPGLVNLHTHASMSLMRGMADDMPLMRWLNDHIWPAEAKHVSPQFVYDGTLLACAEMLRSGVTCFNEMYFFPEQAARAAIDAGMRASIGLIAIEFPTAYASDADDYISKGLEARDQLAGEPLLSFCMAPHAPYTVSDRTFGRVLMLAEELDLPIHVHLHETLDEIDQSVSQYGVRPLERLWKLGLVGPRLIAVHAVHMEDPEIELLSSSGASVAHCPSSNLKLASGFANISQMLERGVTVGIGTDGAASNNSLDMFREMRTAALLAKAKSGNPEAMPAASALRAATLQGAEALGLADRIGTIAEGKFADLCAVSFNSPEMTPCYDPISQLVYSAGRENVTHVWVGGTLRLDQTSLTAPAFSRLDKTIQLWQNKLAR
jgi:5-methylthioadenosine/S-adenosylhomocysteine deaminase